MGVILERYIIYHRDREKVFLCGWSGLLYFVLVLWVADVGNKTSNTFCKLLPVWDTLKHNGIRCEHVNGKYMKYGCKWTLSGCCHWESQAFLCYCYLEWCCSKCIIR